MSGPARSGANTPSLSENYTRESFYEYEVETLQETKDLLLQKVLEISLENPSKILFS